MAADANPFTAPSPDYHRVRPAYPGPTLDHILATDPGTVADIGAGSGKMTGLLAARLGAGRVVAIEPSAPMRRQFRAAHPTIRLCPGTGQATTLAPASIDLAVFAQSFHWMPEAATAAELDRIVTAGGRIAVVFNQMDVSYPWVKRLTRIMRSGDVHRPDRPPSLGPGWVFGPAHSVAWRQELYPAQILSLARTRASYLRSTPVNRARMQANLRWYLEQFLTLPAHVPTAIPYTTLTWIATRAAKPGPGPDSGDTRLGP